MRGFTAQIVPIEGSEGPVDPGYGRPIVPPPPVVGGGPVYPPPVDPGWGQGRPLPPVAMPPIFLPDDDPTPPGTIWPPLYPDEIWPKPPSGRPPVVGGGPAPPQPGRPTPPERPQPGPPPTVGGGPIVPEAKAWVLCVISGPRGVTYRYAVVDLGASVTPPIAPTPEPKPA